MRHRRRLPHLPPSDGLRLRLAVLLVAALVPVAARADPGALEEARRQLRTGHHAEAIAAAKRAGAPGSDEATRDEAAAIRAEAHAAQGQVEAAIAACREVASDGGARRARLLLGELLIRSGKRAQARAPLMTLVEDYKEDRITAGDPIGLTLVGRAAHLLRSPKQANALFNEAERAGGRKLVATLLARADLYLDAYDTGHAGEVVKEALKLAPDDPDVRVAMARVKLENAMDFDGAAREVRRALDVNPRHAGAYQILAGLALREMDIAAADAAVARGLAINPTHLELLSMKAAIRFLADDLPGYEAIKKQVLALNPEYSAFYRIVGEFAEWEHRYEDIVKMMTEATRLDDRDAKAFAALGLNLVRAGDDVGGLAALQKAFARDKFNVRVFNTLNLLEKDLPADYVTVKGQTFTIRYNKDEKPVLERYVPRMLEEAWGSMVKRYEFTPQVPVGIELYADKEHFSIRTSGLPNVGIQGVCFGRTLALLSPGGGSWNWGNVLWHELAHVFAIQLSRNHVPRWFTEGMSEYETSVRRPEWQRREGIALHRALRRGRLPPVEKFNQAFTHADDVADITMAYGAAGQLLVFVIQELGFPRAVAMLRRWATGERTPQVIKGALGITPEELDRRFRAWLGPRLDRYARQFVPDLRPPPLDEARRAAQQDPRDGRKQVELALALWSEGSEAAGDAALAEALRLDPRQPDARFVALRRARAGKDAAAVERIVAVLLADGQDGYVVRMAAADVAEGKRDTALQRRHLEAATRFDPSQPEPLQALYDLAHQRGDGAAELAALRPLALLDQHDRQVWNLLLDGLVRAGLWQEAVAIGEGALFVDVMNWKTHQLYAQALARVGRARDAAFELQSALLCKPGERADRVALHGALAQAYDSLGDGALAAKARAAQQLE